MIRLFSILMSGLILVQSFDIAISDITQLDEFLEHASFHSDKYGDNIFVFISKHYGEQKEQHNKDHQEEKRDHEQLPFQHHCACSSIIAIVVVTSFLDLNSPKSLEFTLDNFKYQAPTSSPHTKGLLQPPQFA